MSLDTISSLGYVSNLNAQATTNIIMQQDKDGDNALSMDELEIPENAFINLDINQDNLVSKDELQNSIASQLVELSKGDISQDDFTDFISSLGVNVPTSTNKEDTLSNDYMTEATSTMLSSLFEENDNTMGLSQFGYFMSVVNAQTQTPTTADKLDAYIQNLLI